MTNRVYRRSHAAEDADQIADRIAEDHLDAGIRFLSNLERTVRKLAETPGMGGVFPTSVPELKGLRVFPVEGFRSYLVFYFELDDHIEVVRVLHGARDLESELRRP